MSAPEPFTPLQLFHYPLFSCRLADAQAHQEGLLKFILDLRERSPGVVKSNRNGWHSGDELLETDDPHVRWLLDNALRYATGALGQYYRNWEGWEIKMGKAWANVLGREGWNAPHHHSPNHWSGCYYVRVGNVGQSRDDLSGMIEFLNPDPGQAVWNRGGNFAVSPRDGLTLLFPSSIVHLVHPHADDVERISVAWNFDVVPKRT